MKLSQFLCCTVLIVLAVLYCIFIVPICDHFVYGMWCIIAWILANVFLCLVYKGTIISREKYLKYFSETWDVLGLYAALLICVLYENYYEDLSIKNGPTIITKYHISETVSRKRGGYASFGYFYIGRQKYDEQFKYWLQPSHKPKGKWSYIMYLLDCEQPLHYYAIDPTEKDIAKIHDFAFLENDTLFSYYDYSLQRPDLVYYTVGFNILQKARSIIINDSTAYLYFTQINNTEKVLSFNIKKYEEIPDTFLVFKNINEKFADNWHVCTPEVNTPENRDKISDYGYIFHYDVYSKQEIETQCPKIKEYLDKYMWDNYFLK